MPVHDLKSIIAHNLCTRFDKNCIRCPTRRDCYWRANNIKTTFEQNYNVTPISSILKHGKRPITLTRDQYKSFNHFIQRIICIKQTRHCPDCGSKNWCLNTSNALTAAITYRFEVTKPGQPIHRKDVAGHE